MNGGDPFDSFPFRFGNECQESCEKEEDNESSEDELDIILHGTPEQKRRLTRSLSHGSLQMSSSEDEFEKEMELELDATMKKHEEQFAASVEKRLMPERSSTGLRQGGTAASMGASTSGSGTRPAASQQYYDDVYFDSEEEDEEGEKETTANENSKPNSTDGEKKKGKEATKKQRCTPSNDELLYDPNIDDENQDWMDKQRAQYYPKRKRETSQIPAQTGNRGALAEAGSSHPAQDSNGKKGQKSLTIPKTDAVLNCPACMSTLCIDCQRHELYTNQYRAMFVMNCCVIRNEQLRYPTSKKKRRWRKRRRHEEGDEEEEGGNAEGVGPTEGDELYHPVKCSICNTEVAVVDTDDVFHFFNVLSSAA